MSNLHGIYRAYIACLNSRTLQDLHSFVDAEVIYNNRKVGLSGYIQMLEQNFAEIPDLGFEIGLLICDNDYVASRLQFNCTPVGSFLGLPVGGRRIVFTENVIYQFRGNRIAEVWSVIDKAAIEVQLDGSK